MTKHETDLSSPEQITSESCRGIASLLIAHAKAVEGTEIKLVPLLEQQEEPPTSE